MARRQTLDKDIRRILEKYDVSDPEHVLDQSDREFIPARDASESEDNLEVNSEHSDTVREHSETDSDDHEFTAKLTSSVLPASCHCQCNIVRGSPGSTHATDVAITM